MFRVSRELGTPLPSAAVADEGLSTAEDLGYTHRDIAAVQELLGRLSNDATPAVAGTARAR